MDSGWTMPYAHCHAAHEIYILESGKRTVTIDDIEYEVNAHDVTMFLPNHPHRSRGDVPFSGICIHFSERYLDIYFSAEAKNILMKCFKNTVIHLCKEDFNILKSIADNFDNTMSNNFLLLAYILDILSRSKSAAYEETSDKTEKKKKKSQEIIEYVNDNYVYIKQIHDIAELFDVSENYIFVLFRKHYNMAPKQYINNLRIKNVCHRLKYSDRNIKVISYSCGFDCYEHFINVFKKIVGCTPTEYQKNE